RDYLYIPLGGNRKGDARTALNIMLIFALSGLWHGSAWNFVLWGVYWGVFSIVARFLLGQRVYDKKIEWRDFPDMIATFGVVALGFYFFRCSDALEIISGLKGIWLYLVFFVIVWIIAKGIVRYRSIRIVTVLVFGAIVILSIGYLGLHDFAYLLKFWWLIPTAIVAILEWRAKNQDCPMQKVSDSEWKRLLLYAVCIFFIAISEPTEMTFIYFQF
ncbi:MAG: hypothetical protein K2M16_09755, partial [Muribaculaceae bacterium]|nr:hypothetical protein [Muribaculaceae bacterium]